ncbi:Cytochrome c oxidase subunit 5b-1, mitochondrial-like protein [Drosera capensis]
MNPERVPIRHHSISSPPLVHFSSKNTCSAAALWQIRRRRRRRPHVETTISSHLRPRPLASSLSSSSAATPPHYHRIREIISWRSIIPTVLSAPWLASEFLEAPAVVKSVFDERIVGCPGGDGEDEHDVVWFWLKKGKPVECPICTQYFVLEVVGKGGSPHGHDDEEDHAH